jgi:hypothetical protein
MKTIIHHDLKRAGELELERVIEPLASYVCAADRPRAALISALEFLFNEVALTHSAAAAHLTTFSESRS